MTNPSIQIYFTSFGLGRHDVTILKIVVWDRESCPATARRAIFGWFPKDRRVAISGRTRSGVAGRGALTTRVAIGLAETPEAGQAFADTYLAMPESILATDTGTAFAKLGKQFQVHLQVNYSEAPCCRSCPTTCLWPQWTQAVCRRHKAPATLSKDIESLRRRACRTCAVSRKT
jgi:hypothetical protein